MILVIMFFPVLSCDTASNELRRPTAAARSDEFFRYRAPSSSAHYWHCTRITRAAEVMKFYESGAALAQEMEVPVTKMQDSIEDHYASLKNGQGSRWRTVPRMYVMGRSLWQDGLWEEVFTTTISLHSMGGLEIDEDSAVLGSGSEAIRGLCAAGEVVL